VFIADIWSWKLSACLLSINGICKIVKTIFENSNNAVLKNGSDSLQKPMFLMVNSAMAIIGGFVSTEQKMKLLRLFLRQVMGGKECW
jgi:hypothetical protein